MAKKSGISSEDSDAVKGEMVQVYLALFRKLAEEVKKNGTFMKTKTGYEQVRPAYTHMMEIAEKINQLQSPGVETGTVLPGKSGRKKLAEAEFNLD